MSNLNIKPPLYNKIEEAQFKNPNSIQISPPQKKTEAATQSRA